MKENSVLEMQELITQDIAQSQPQPEEERVILESWLDPDNPLTPESVCSIDERQKVVATQQMPYMAICKLYMKAQDGGTYVGSGWLVAPDKLYTAGHCVYSANSGGWKSSIVVIPGKSGLTEPYGRYNAVSMLATRGWVEQGSTRYDMGAIKLDRPVEHASFLTPQLRDEDTGEVCGYPADRDNGTFQYTQRGTLSKLNGRFRYYIDTYGGQSGCPLLKNGSTAIGIHNYGGCPNKSSDLYPEFIDGVNAW